MKSVSGCAASDCWTAPLTSPLRAAIRAPLMTRPGPEETAPDAMAEPTTRAYRNVLAIPGARALIAASAASQIGNWLYNAALLVYVYSATRSVAWVGAATICRLLPYVLLGPFGGR